MLKKFNNKLTTIKQWQSLSQTSGLNSDVSSLGTSQHSETHPSSKCHLIKSMFFSPPEIVFLRSPTPSHLPHMDTPEIVYDILEGNVQNSFDIIKRLDHGMIVGECHYGMWLTMPADRRPSPEASLSGNNICIKWFSDLISHYERFSSFFCSLNKPNAYVSLCGSTLAGSMNLHGEAYSI